MNCDGHQKVTASHLQRDAYLYVRQSTLRQVLENTGAIASFGRNQANRAIFLEK